MRGEKKKEMEKNGEKLKITNQSERRVKTTDEKNLQGGASITISFVKERVL